MRTIVLATLAVAVLSSNALAQEAQTYGLASTGLTLGNTSAVAVGAELGTSVGEHLQIYATAGYHKDLLPRSAADMLDAFADAGLTMRAPAFLVSTGARYLIRGPSGVTPYVSGGVGAAKLQLKATLQGFGEVTDDLVEAGYLTTDDVTVKKPLVEVGAGVAVPLGSTLQLDLGYKYIKIIGEERFGVSRLAIGVGVRF